MDNVWGLLIGIAMGFFIQRVRASSPAMIAANLRLENLSVIKFMAMTMAVGMMLVYGLTLVVPEALHFNVKPTYVVGVLLGGLIFGVGFALSGYCPGTCAVGIGEGRRDAWVALAGGITGALLFSLIYRSLLEPIVKLMDFGKITLADVLGVPVVPLAMVVGVLFIAVVAWLPTERPVGSAQ
jgi:uncharacterized membrane protein YedE/YeeE